MTTKQLNTKITFPDLCALTWAQHYTPNGEHAVAEEEPGLPALNWGLPDLCWGPPGSLKTAVKKMVAIASDIPYLILDTSWGDAATAQIPVPDMKLQANRFFAGEWLARFSGDDARGLIILDDLTTWTPSEQAKLLGGLQNKRFGSKYAGPLVRVTANANEPRDAPGGWPLAKAVANRAIHIDWMDPELMRIIRYNAKGGLVSKAARKERKAMAGDFGFQDISAEDMEAAVLEQWDSVYADKAGMVNGYLIANKGDPKIIRNEPDASDPQAGRAWLSPRTLAPTVASLLTTSQIHNLSEAASFALVAGSVGEPWAIGFMNWMINRDIPNAGDFLDGHAEFQHRDSRMDRTFALIAACVSTVVPSDAPKRIARTKVLWTFLAECGDSILDGVAELVHQELFAAGLTSHRKFPEAIPVIKKLKTMMQATDLTKLVSTVQGVK